jgi:tRNA-2-methylthio-N6-dimethylallyladenosine synthase
MKNVEEKELKIHDESRQGEAFPLVESNYPSEVKTLFLESYGCAMNFSDSEIVASILMKEGYKTVGKPEEADLILVNTCSIRENAESRVRQRLHDFKKIKVTKPNLTIGVLGCMAERLKSQLLEEEKLVDLVVGPDAYRDLPQLIETVETGQKAVNVILSKEETYGDIAPIRLHSNGVTAFVSITRGCDNMCSFCVVPFTRGRERSRDPESIISEARDLFERGYKEITLLGQNVDSYKWTGGGLKKYKLSEAEEKSAVSFANLLEMVALVSPELRVRFSTSHPKDMTDDVLHVVAKYENICKYIHLPVQSGSSVVLDRMNRGYTNEWYRERINSIRRIIPECGISTDIITGFCGETEDDHQQTLELMKWVNYDFAYMFSYSERPKTLAERKYEDDIPEKIKSRRLKEVVATQLVSSAEKTALQVGKIHKVLIEGDSKKSPSQWMGRNSQNAVVVFDKEHYRPGDYVNVFVDRCTAATLIGKVISKA